MKYIRTTKGIWEIEKLTKQDYEWLQKGENKQADTIEELCDECISVLENGKGSHIWHESEFEEKTPYLFHNARMFKEDDEIIYGAIWTEWGLKYVAKMNEKGELELL